MAQPVTNEFNLLAVPPPALARRLHDLALAGSGATIHGTQERDRREAREREADEDWRGWMEMAAAVYSETQRRVLDMMDDDEEASRRAMLAIGAEMARRARERQEMMDNAVKLDDGTAIFLSEDGRSIYTADGRRLSDEEAARVLEEKRAELEAGYTWEQMQEKNRIMAELEAERAEIERRDRERAEMREKVERGELTQEELEEWERRFEAEAPDRVKQYRAEITAERAAGITTGELSPDELAAAADPAAEPTLARRFNNMAAPVLADPVLVEPVPPPSDPLPAEQRVAPIAGPGL